MKDAKGALAMELFIAAEQQDEAGTMINDVIAANTTGYLTEKSLKVLDAASVLAKWTKHVFTFRVCSRCKAMQEMEANTEEAVLFRNTLAFLFSNRLFTEPSVLAYALGERAKKKDPLTTEQCAGKAKEQIPSAFKANAKTAVVEIFDKH